MTAVYKIEIMIIDFEKVGADGIKQILEQTHYPNYCIDPKVMSMETRYIDWADDHPLNKSDFRTVFKDLFRT